MTTCRRSLLPGLVALLIVLVAGDAWALPHWSRIYGVSCNTCHTVVPKLNLRGMDFLARGYRPDPRLGQERKPSIPVSLWLAGRKDAQIAKKHDDLYFSKVEVMAADSLGSSFSYMAEWRAFDLEAQANGTLRDRSGRFEDLWLSWQIDSQWTLTFGQYRPLGQVEAGRKLSISTPAIFDTSVSGQGRSARLKAVDGFSPNTRSPGITLGYQSIGSRDSEFAMDGLYHQVTLPFVGEISAPLSRNARVNASNELELRARGVVLETWYRKGFSSLGVHSFIDSNRYMLNTVGTLNSGELFFTGGLGVSKVDGHEPRMTSTLEIEYLPTMRDDTWRPAFGVRVDNVSHNHTPAAIVPYITLATPNTDAFTSLLQVEYYAQPRNERFRVDFSILF